MRLAQPMSLLSASQQLRKSLQSIGCNRSDLSLNSTPRSLPSKSKGGGDDKCNNLQYSILGHILTSSIVSRRSPLPLPRPPPGRHTPPHTLVIFVLILSQIPPPPLPHCYKAMPSSLHQSYSNCSPSHACHCHSIPHNRNHARHCHFICHACLPSLSLALVAPPLGPCSTLSPCLSA
jgi:hypothetical protein